LALVGIPNRLHLDLILDDFRCAARLKPQLHQPAAQRQHPAPQLFFRLPDTWLGTLDLAHALD
jgi:hypothetical protein